MNTEMGGHDTETLGIFTINVPHILDKIFFYLDYESYKKCYKVNSTWYELLTSDSYQKKAKAVFCEDIWEDEDKLWSAATYGNISGVKSLLHPLVDVNCVRGSYIKSTPLIEAARSSKFGHNIVVQMLLDKGANPNKEDENGLAPLQYGLAACSVNKNLTTVKALLDAGADPNVGWHSLWYTVFFGNKVRNDVVKVLLDAGADPNKRDETGDTPLHTAAKYSYKDVIKVLLDGGADPYVANNDGNTPLDIARQQGPHTWFYFIALATSQSRHAVAS